MIKKIFLSLVLGALFLWLAVRNVDFHEVARRMSEVDLLYLFLAAPMIIGLTALRAWRMMKILSPVKKVSFKSMFAITSVGFMAIISLPFRLGELIRPYLLKREENIGFTSGLAAVAVERVFDGLSLVAFFIFSVVLAGGSERAIDLGGVQVKLFSLAVLASGVFLSAFIFLLLVILKRDLAEGAIGWLCKMLPHRIEDAVKSSVSRFIDGLSALPDIESCVVLFVQSVSVWVLNSFFLYLTLLACGIHLPILYSLPIQAIICIVISVPAGPGFIGSYQLAAVGGLMFFGVDKSSALAFSFVNHFLTLLGVLGLGLIYLPSFHIRLSTAIEEASSAGSGVSDEG